MSVTLLLVGCGKMGGAMLQGWLSGNQVAAAHVVEPSSAADHFAASNQIRVYDDADSLPAGLHPDIIVLAVKPQQMADVAPRYTRFLGPRTVVLSVAAGKPLSFFADIFGGDAAIVRCMPNTPAAIGQGMLALVANSHADSDQQRLCGRLMGAVGDVAWLDDESLMHAVTAVSGSGPAYVFLLIEALTHAGVAQGLDHDLAAKLATRTVAGAGALAADAEESATRLRRNVASPGGTTAAALDVLMEDGALDDLMAQAVDAAARRSQELAGD